MRTTSPRPIPGIALTAALIGALSLSACGGETIPESFDWDHSAGALVAARGTAGGYVPQMLSFSESLYGSPFVRLMGDGSLYYGTPTRVSLRKLSEGQMQQLLLELRPDLFGGYQAQYQAAQATDMPTTTIKVDVQDWGSHAVGIYGLSGVSDQEPLSLPATLLDAAKALQAAAVSGAAYTPTRLRLGAEKIDLAHYPQVDKAKVQDWPLTSVALGQASIYGPPEQGVVLTGAAQVNQVLALLKGKEEVFFAQTDVVFRQGSDYYWVAYIAMVP